jgi:16S rRNA (cytidine1402-2'-O)-methyltransferase
MNAPNDILRAMSDSTKTLPAGPALYVVATPIGNLEDITHRALRVLEQVDLIACEDTRQTQKLLEHYGIKTRTISYHEHNESERAAELAEYFAEGKNIAVVSDAGTPGVSDPGYRVITEAIRGGVPVVPIPGPAAFVAALVASGLPTDSFRFEGFVPAKQGQRRTTLESLRGAEQTLVFYEAPHRIEETLQDILATLGASRRVVIAREVTKIHEEFLRGTAEELLSRVRERPPKGEIVLLIAKSEGEERKQKSVFDRVQEAIASESLDEKSALKKVAKELGLSRSEAYREWQRGKR